jgi:anaerobic magnesium-protoporphyrin IX monomethyl ester cyclase
VVAKCRPDSVEPGLVRFLGDGIGLVRMYMGIENFSPRGLEHLGRSIDRGVIEKSLEAFLSAGIYCCYNILLFEPDTVLEDIEINLDAIEQHRAVPFNMARTEIYNGTAMWGKLKQEGRLKGNYLATDYEIADPSAEAMFRIFAEAFKDRFFALDSLSNMNSSLGYEVKLIEHFAEGEGAKAAGEMKREVENLTAAINMDTLAHLREAHEFARRGGWKNNKDMVKFTIELARRVNFSGARLYSTLLNMRKGLGDLENIGLTTP